MARMSQLAGFEQGHRLRHGRHVDRRVALRRRVRAGVRTREVAGVRLRAPMLDIHTVAAGGGSILHFDGSRYRVGPDSAGADSGPSLLPPRRAAHGHRRQRDARPHPAGALPTGVRSGRRPAARRRGRAARGSPSWPPTSRAATGDDRTPEQVADGYLQIAVANMANAVKRISVQKGHDVTEYVLTTFGGAGGQHACAVADSLGIRTVLDPADGRRALRARHRSGRHHGDARAVGRGAARTARPSTASGEVADALEADRPRRAARRRACPTSGSASSRRAHLRYDGTDTALAGRARRPGRHGGRRSRRATARRTPSCWSGHSIVEAVSVEAIGLHRQPDCHHASPRSDPDGARCPARDRAPVGRRTVAGRAAAPSRADACRDETVTGPAIIAEANATTVVDDGWRATMTGDGHLLRRAGRSARRSRRRHRGRPGAAGDLQQPVHVDRRADGRAAGVHRTVGEHQGTARLLLRAVRPATAT